MEAALAGTALATRATVRTESMALVPPSDGAGNGSGAPEASSSETHICAPTGSVLPTNGATIAVHPLIDGIVAALMRTAGADTPTGESLRMTNARPSQSPPVWVGS